MYSQVTNALFNAFTAFGRSSLIDKSFPQYDTADAKIEADAKNNEVKENPKLKIHSTPTPRNNRKSYFKAVTELANSVLVIVGFREYILINLRKEVTKMNRRVMEDMGFPFLKKSFWDSLRSPRKSRSILNFIRKRKIDVLQNF